MSAKELAASKRQKKREVDRRCQREARQRTKARIAYLEELVDELRQQDTSGQVASLMQQVAEARNERDQFARTLRGIEDSIRGHREQLDTAPEKAVATGNEADMRGASGVVDNQSPAFSLQSPSFPLSSGAQSAGKQRPAPFDSTNAGIGSPTLHHSDTYGLSTAINRNLVISSNGPCPHCEQLEDANPRPQSLWRFSNEVLNARPVLTTLQLQCEDEVAEDTPVRAVVEGWDAATKRLGGTLPPLWQALRRLDEKVFADIKPVERLAIMRVMHILYRYHADPTTQTASVPSWLLPR